MSAGAAPLSREALLSRTFRFASLRAAQRALAPSVAAPEALLHPALGRSIRDGILALSRRLDAADAPDPGSDAPELRAVDAALKELARELGRVADGISLQQYRAVVPQLLPEQREEVIGLLELCIDGDRVRDGRLPLLDYLLTSLCARREDGTWVVVEDPAAVSDRVRRLACDAEGRDREAQLEVTARFREASERLGAGEELVAVVREMATYKAALAEHFFLPEVLRSVLYYNVFVRNLREEQLRRTRAIDREISREISLSGRGIAAAETGAIAAAEAMPATAFESPGLDAVEQALSLRISGGEPGAEPAARIAARLDPAQLGALERAAFAPAATGELDPCVRRCVAVGLASEPAPEVEGALRELGIDPQRLRRDWVREVGNEVQKRINHGIALDSFESAQQLSELRTRFLYAPLARGIRERAREKVDPGLAAGVPAEAAAAAQAPPRSKTAAAGTSPELPERASRWRLRPAWLAVAAAALVVALGVYWPTTHPRAVQALETEELVDLSSWLVSGYRSRRGAGSLFVAILGPGWTRSGEGDRLEMAQQIRDRLARSGVREILLYDEGRALQAHWDDGALRYWSGARDGRSPGI